MWLSVLIGMALRLSKPLGTVVIGHINSVEGQSMKSALTAAALIFAATPAFAADAYADSAGFSWSGLYAGIHFGYANGSSDLFIQGLGQLSLEPNGFVGGVHIGVNHQMASRLVIGAEADISYNAMDDVVFDPVAGALLESGIEWSGSARMRVGYAFDRTLPYVTAGVAAGKLEAGANNTGVTAVPLHDDTHIGWTAGAGVERAFAERWSARLEYRYTDFGEKELSTAAGLGGEANIDLSMHDLRVGLSYRF